MTVICGTSCPVAVQRSEEEIPYRAMCFEKGEHPIHRAQAKGVIITWYNEGWEEK